MHHHNFILKLYHCMCHCIHTTYSPMSSCSSSLIQHCQHHHILVNACETSAYVTLQAWDVNEFELWLCMPKTLNKSVYICRLNSKLGLWFFFAVEDLQGQQVLSTSILVYVEDLILRLFILQVQTVCEPRVDCLLACPLTYALVLLQTN